MNGNEVEINGKKIAIDSTLEMEVNSPFFDREENITADGTRINPQGKLTSGFSKITSGELQGIIGHIDKLQMKNQPREIKGAKLISNGTVIDTGVILVDLAKSNLNNKTTQFEFTFIGGDADAYLQKVGEKNLNELTLNGPINIPGHHSSWGHIISPPSFELEDMVLFTSQVNSGSGGSFPSPVTYDDVFPDEGKVVNASTAYYAEAIVNAGHAYFCFPTVVVYSGTKDDDGNSIYRVLNRWRDGFNTYSTEVKIHGNGTYTAYTMLDNPLAPMFYYHQVLKHCFSEFGYTLQDDWILNDTQLLKKVLFNAHNIIRPMTVSMQNIHGQGTDDTVFYYEEDTQILPANHLPALSITEFLRDFMLEYACHFEFNGVNVSIKHQEFDKAQREIKIYGPDITVKPERKTGLKLAYALDNDSYKKEQDFKGSYADLPDETSFADLAEGDLYIDRNFNSIYQVTGGIGVHVCSNIIPYNTGDAKSYELPISPINCRVITYDKIVGDLFATGANIDAFMPFVNATISGYGERTYTYKFNAERLIPYGTPMIAWAVEHDYTFERHAQPEVSDPSSYTISGFYHGLMSNMDMISYDPLFVWPYMSFHNYCPGAASPVIGNWHSGIIGNEGLIKTFWGKFINVFNNNRKVMIDAKESLYDIRAHQWNRTVICRGTELYIAVMRTQLPLVKFPIYECYEI